MFVRPGLGWGQSAGVVDGALRRAATAGGRGVSAVVLEFGTGQVLAAVGPGPGGGSLLRGLPGSTLKPMFLNYALRHGIVSGETAVYCRRSLRVAGRDLACTHPADQTMFRAEEALAFSCNTYFAAMARRFTPAQMVEALRQAGMGEAAGRVAVGTPEEREIAVLGLARGEALTPVEMAGVYRQMVRGNAADGLVEGGLRRSVMEGMAAPARTEGVDLLGKTGTASDPGQAWTHGWFAGVVPGRMIVVVYVAHGDGGDAARVAHAFFEGLGRGR